MSCIIIIVESGSRKLW